MKENQICVVNNVKRILISQLKVFHYMMLNVKFVVMYNK